MLPALALILQAKGCAVAGSDRALDQRPTSQEIRVPAARGIALYPQDGSGINRIPIIIVVTSAAIESTVPDVEAARRLSTQG